VSAGSCSRAPADITVAMDLQYSSNPGNRGPSPPRPSVAWTGWFDAQNASTAMAALNVVTFEVTSTPNSVLPGSP